jgi:hypothetical protein
MLDNESIGRLITQIKYNIAMRFTICDVVFVSEDITLTKEVFGKFAADLPSEYISAHLSVEELLSEDNFPTALVVLATQQLIDSKSFGRLSEYIVKRMNSPYARYCRTFMIPHDMTFEQFKKQCDSGHNEGLNEISDVVHLDSFKNPDDLKDEMMRFIKNEGNAQRYYKYVGFKNMLKIVSGSLCNFLIWISIIASVLMYLFYFYLGKYSPEVHNFIFRIYEDNGSVSPLKYGLTLMLGLATVIPLVNLFYVLRNGLKNFFVNNQREKNLWYFIGQYLVLALVIDFAYKVVNPDWQMIVLALSAAITIDVVRRSYYSGYRGYTVKEVDKSIYTAREQKLSKNILYSTESAIFDALHLPYTSSMRNKVFISYTHSCKWSVDMAEQLYQHCNKNGVICFVDKYGIARGSSWRLALHEKMTDATHIICIVSEQTAQKAWPAAEIETALRMRAKTSMPKIIVLLPERFDETTVKSPTVVYEEVFKQKNEEAKFVRVINSMDGVVPALCNSLSRGNHSSGILGTWELPIVLLQLLTGFVKGIFTVLSGISFLIYMGIVVINNYSKLTTLEAALSLVQTKIGGLIQSIVLSDYCFFVFVLASYFTSVEITAIVEDTFLIARKKKINSYLVSQLIVLAFSLCVLYAAFPYLPVSGFIAGGIALIAGCFLTSASNKSQVEISDELYYRNDSNKGMNTRDLPPVTYKHIDNPLLRPQSVQSALEGLNTYISENNLMGRIYEGFGKGENNNRLICSEGALMKLLPIAESCNRIELIADFNYSLGIISALLGKYNEAIRYFKTGLACFYGMTVTFSNLDHYILRIHEFLAVLYKLTGKDNE